METSNKQQEFLKQIEKIRNADAHKSNINSTKELATQKRAELVSYQTATVLKNNLTKELEDKVRLRKYLVIGLGAFFIIITVAVFYIVICMNDKVNIEVQKYLITGLFGNLLGLLLIVYRYAFSDTHKITKSISNLLH